MFDPVTAHFLRQAPALSDLDPQRLPQIMTARYAELVARRLRQADDNSVDEGDWPLTRIADTYELIASIHDDPATRRAAAFVAGTAHQIVAQQSTSVAKDNAPPILHRDGVDPSLAAALLFLAAEQYADANEAAQRIRIVKERQTYVAAVLARDVRDLAQGKLANILERAQKRPKHFKAADDFEEQGTTALFESLIVGLEFFAAEVLAEPIPAHAAGRFEGARAAFQRVLELSTQTHDLGEMMEGQLLTTYPGPRHLASLLLAVYDATGGKAVTKLDLPPDADASFWKKWLRHRAASAPFVWHNHREALNKGFHHSGTSAVMVLPTGAGKTTVSCVKIASVLAQGKSVIFLAPTHALVEQLTADLHEVFPEELLGSEVISDFDKPFFAGMAQQEIKVMTPEHCLALLSFAPDVFAEVGLMVFDECHLLSPVSGLRRALDGMFCVLAFNSILPTADFLFLSAMIRNGDEFAEWIATLTGRECIFVDPLWKPSRQARGVVIYPEQDIINATKAAAKNPSALPSAIFGLQHNWLNQNGDRLSGKCSLQAISEQPAPLAKNKQGKLTGNVNKVAAHLAVAAVQNGLKTVVFVNKKDHTTSTAKTISDQLIDGSEPNDAEAARWQALEEELGGLEHSLLMKKAAAVPHNAGMLRLERDIAERMFRRKDGAQVIVATPTLAQGLNLPAHMAILASDMRSGDDGSREALGAHELLNAAARAGRAGHLANGIVLLIPEAVLTFTDKGLDRKVFSKLKSILPEDDRCLDMIDPLQEILDRITAAKPADLDVEYALNRLSTTIAPEGLEIATASRFAMGRSFAAFMAGKQSAREAFDVQVVKLNTLLASSSGDADDEILRELAARSGASLSVLKRLRERLAKTVAKPPLTILDWIAWVFAWLAEDDDARRSLLEREKKAILSAVGLKASADLDAEALKKLLPGVKAWLTGKPLKEIEQALGGDLHKQDKGKKMTSESKKCPRARELVTKFVPQGLTFIVGLVASAAKDIPQPADGVALPRYMMEVLSIAVRRGFDDPAKLIFSHMRKDLFSRVQWHQAYLVKFPNGFPLDGGEDYTALAARMRNELGA